MMEGQKLMMHERGLLEDEGEVLGVQLHPRKTEARPTEKRPWRLDRALRWCQRRRTVSGLQLERVLGHAPFNSLLGRNTLGSSRPRALSSSSTGTSSPWSCRRDGRMGDGRQT